MKMTDLFAPAFFFICVCVDVYVCGFVLRVYFQIFIFIPNTLILRRFCLGYFMVQTIACEDGINLSPWFFVTRWYKTEIAEEFPLIKQDW